MVGTTVLALSGYSQALGISETHMLYEKRRARVTCVYFASFAPPASRR